MLLYRCNQGHVTVDNAPEWIFTEPQVEEVYTDVDDSWSGDINDIWSTESTYQRPSIDI